jgi:hypothetical protein
LGLFLACRSTRSNVCKLFPTRYKIPLRHPPFARFDNTLITNTIKEYWDYEKYPIKTEFEKGEPRLLLVCIDVMDATTAVTFDSYSCKTKYLDGKSNEQNSKQDYNYIIEYPDGISIEHVSASMLPHLKYKYPQFSFK